MIEKAKQKAHINIVIMNGRMYIEKFKEAFQTRDTVTIWGILQLLRLYPGKLPDLDLMFECGDTPKIRKQDYARSNAAYPLPPLFHYCGDDSSFDIVFPDWSFWGWPELNIKPWDILKKDLQEGNSRIKWSDRETYAYWKGNAKVSAARYELVKCNASEWNTRIDQVDWGHEIKHGFETADLASQCTYRYKIYAEGVAWSAQEIGKTGSKYVQEQLRMKYVYDYMFHLLNEYSKLQKYKPTVPKGAVEVCTETMVCSVEGLMKKFRIDSMVKDPADSSPCTMPSSYYPAELEDFLEMKENLTKQVQDWGYEIKHGFETADLASQCTHRYKIYAEGVAWSVSEKYILACDSMSLMINSRYYDFFTRSLLPTIHYWPINEKDKCKSIKFAVKWGNKHMKKAQEIGKTGSKYVQEKLRMKYVYDYMFHSLNEYSKLQKYKPTVPKGAVEVCSETMVCSVEGSMKKFRIDSMVKDRADSSPCTMPSSYYPTELEDFLEMKENLTKQVRMLEENESIGISTIKI
ncbi:unnamed protein product [Fraxinus pennsylvanica]|uniref:Glycosyl transferase CAP10 domain-containing protein n=1 Tax=Fraxinus pennsylvanica TaxID=56036 RepID=A0AAD1ZKS0_9LAMI|nr:unnamed protein product [Fraxinus pennsylvanica]